MALDPNRRPWIPAAEAALRALRDIEDVRIQALGDAIREIHIISSAQRPAKQIVRDVQTLLLTRFDRAIDHRVVSVAFTDPTAAVPAPRPIAFQERAAEPEPDEAEDRIRFGSVNLFVSGPKAQAQVELQWKGVMRTGSASGWSSRDGAHRLIAAATLAALQEFVEDEVGLALSDISWLRMGRNEVVVVALLMLAHRQEKMLVGSCAVEQDAQQAVALATLGAVNRVVGGLRIKQPTEYVLRPSTTQEASGAKGS